MVEKASKPLRAKKALEAEGEFVEIRLSVNFRFHLLRFVQHYIVMQCGRMKKMDGRSKIIDEKN